MRKQIELFLIIALVGFISCSIDKQSNDLSIDSKRIGDIQLCTKISELIKKYPNAKPMDFEGDEGVTWKGFKITFSNQEWIIIEASWIDIDRIWRITTNSPKYTTINGYKVGDKISKIKKSGDRISYYESEMGFELQSDKLNFGFELENRYTESFYKKINACNNWPDYMNLIDDNASIQSITISGECK